MTFEQQALQIGCIRFGIGRADKRLMPWKAACKAAGIGIETRAALERAGVMRGAHRNDWFGVAVSMPLSEIELDVWVDAKWHRANVDEMARVWSENEARKSSA